MLFPLLVVWTFVVVVVALIGYGVIVDAIGDDDKDDVVVKDTDDDDDMLLWI